MLRIKEPELEKLLGFLTTQEEFVLLDTSRPDMENCVSLLFVEPVERLVCTVADDQEQYLDFLQSRLENGYYLAGWVGYEFGAMLEERGVVIKQEPADAGGVIADFGVFSKPFNFDHHTGENNLPLDNACNLKDVEFTIANLQSNMEKEEFLRALEVVQQYIAAGDTYQVNYTLKLLFDFSGSTEKFYGDLRRNQSVAYGAYIRNGQERILSFSPELFFRKRGSEITVRPMKGTAKRGFCSEEEGCNSLELKRDIKNRSENVMIVDLLRNDLARLMHGHGQSRVFVESLFDIESYESLLQMTSTIKAQATESTMQKFRLTDFFRALFPCGSITGAPKIRTMQIIDELEKDRRGVYTGAIGYFGPDGSATFNVPIRTVRLLGDRGEMGIGAGITHDSVPEEEWKESLLKGRFLTHSQPDFRLFETILWQPGVGYWLLESHLRRLENGANYFKYAFDKETICALLQQESKKFTAGCYRVRLSLEKDGRLACLATECELPTCTSLPDVPPPVDEQSLPVVAFSSHQTATDNPWIFHKTTIRQLYDSEYKQAREEDIFDLLFCNEKGEVTEGCITNIIIYKDGRYSTPPVRCGLLDGTMRGQLLADTKRPVFEEIITEEIVREADAVYLCNSVRGIVRVKVH